MVEECHEAGFGVSSPSFLEYDLTVLKLLRTTFSGPEWKHLCYTHHGYVPNLVSAHQLYS